MRGPSHNRNHPRISRPVQLLRPSYDVVVIGSGYGGAVAASRMARGKQSVCVLERGKERWPGEYPSTLTEAVPQIHVSGTRASDAPVHDTGDPTGLYHLVLGEGQNAFVANGLGGTSLLNANIFLRADERTLALKYWPKEIWSDPSSLEKYYARAEEMLQPEPYPASFPQLHKLALLEKQAAQLGVHDKFYRPPQTTRFVDGLNAAGVYMNKSTLSGQDSTGVNDGSKNSTLVTYLADAWNWGAELFCECEARYVKKHSSGEGYLVFFAWHGASRDEFGSEVVYSHLMWVHAKKMVFLGAGALGSTEIVLRSRQLGLKTAEYVGRDMSGNGDILAFGYNLKDEANAVGREDPDPTRPVGPTITGIIDLRDTMNPLDGFVVEEGAFPGVLAPLLQPVLELSSTSFPSLSPASFLRRLKSRVLGPYARDGSVEHTQVYLAMSHDSNQATLTLDSVTSRPRLVFAGVGRAEHAAEIRATLSELGGTLVQSPFYAFLDQAEITVHAIGGMNLGRATSHLGEVLDDEGKVHDGLCVVDGALVPTALGVNPFATITALAERAVEGVGRKFGVQIDYTTHNAPLNFFGTPQFPVQLPDDVTESALLQARKAGSANIGVGFTELMTGFVHVGGEIEQFGVAASQARADLHAAAFFLSVLAPDESALLARRDHPAMLTGTMISALPGSPHMITSGHFGLFTFDERTPDTRNLTYEFDMLGIDDQVLHFSGYKVISNAAAFSVYDIWKATSTLYVTVTRGPGGEVVGRGIMSIKASDFAKELKTVSATGASAMIQLGALERFAGFFASQLSRFFFAPFMPLNDTAPTSNALGFAARPVPNEMFNVTASDGVVSPMQLWEPTISNGFSILFVPGASVDERIFALPTIPLNAIEYFTRAGYRCYCVTTRIGRTPNSRIPETTPYNARLDVYAALREVVARSGGERAYVIAHCVGSLALACGLLDGTIPGREWIRGISTSQLFMHPILGSVNEVKARLPLPGAYTLFERTEYFDCVPQNQSGLAQRALDQLLRFYPVGARKEICSSGTCHRTELAFGRCWNHSNLNTATHDHLDEYFGGISIATLRQLAAMGRARVVLSPDGAPLIVPPVPGKSALEHDPADPALERLRGIPIMLFSGADNVVFAPEGTDVSYSLLRDTFGADMYERVLFKGRGHLDSWMSATCANKGDVFDTVLRHTDAICKQGKLGTGDDGFGTGKREVVCF